jgi:hypothetical protein
MSSRRYPGAVIVSVVAAGIAATGCTKSAGPAAGTSSGVDGTTSSSLAGITKVLQFEESSHEGAAAG